MRDRASLPGGHSELEPPDPIPNSEVKRLSADDSVGSPHAKVGHRQALNVKTPQTFCLRGFFMPDVCQKYGAEGGSFTRRLE